MVNRVATMSLIMIVACAVLIGVFSYIVYINDAINNKGIQAKGIASSVAAAIDPEEFNKIAETLEHTDYWYAFETYLDDVKARTQVTYLYILFKSADGQFPYMMEGQTSDESPDTEVVLGMVDDAINFAPEAFTTFETNVAMTSSLYETEEYGTLISAFAPIQDKNGQAIGVVAVDLNIDDVMQTSYNFLITLVITILVLCIISGVFARSYLKNHLGKQINEITEASKKMAVGNLDISLVAENNDEIGQLIESFDEMVKSTQNQANILDAIANGNLTKTVSLRSENDTMSIAMQKMLSSLRHIVAKINSGSDQVASNADQFSFSSAHLASVSIEQANVVGNLSVSIDEITNNVKNSAQMAEQASALATTIRESADKGSLQMSTLKRSVHEIEEASDSINKIISTIDDIAFQTNILALNAAVEAARAGAHGKGFAVVADEVRNLAERSAKAARETGTLISASREKSREGVNFANITSSSLEMIVSEIIESNDMIEAIKQYAKEQELLINKINNDIGRVTEATQQNAATAEESAAVSEELSAQSAELHSLVGNFKID